VCGCGIAKFDRNTTPARQERLAALDRRTRPRKHAPMTTRLYRRTEAGRKAWETQNDRIPLECRRVLGLIGVDTDPDKLRARLGFSEAALNEILEELEQQSLVQSIEASLDRTDLDFTGKFSAAEIQAAQQAAREELDFTGGFSLADLRGAKKKD
jgi:hypothetical protein